MSHQGRRGLTCRYSLRAETLARKIVNEFVVTKLSGRAITALGYLAPAEYKQCLDDLQPTETRFFVQTVTKELAANRTKVPDGSSRFTSTQEKPSAA